MKTLRNSTFETNSSSTHSLVITNNVTKYTSNNPLIIVKFINTDEESELKTLNEKVSYIISQIINKYKFEVSSYEDLKSLIERDYDYIKVIDYVKNVFGKQVELPKNYTGDIEEIVNINHQIYCDNLDELLRDLVEQDTDSLLNNVLGENTVIVFGRD